MERIVIGRIMFRVHEKLERKTGKICPRGYFVAKATHELLNDCSLFNHFKREVLNQTVVEKNEASKFMVEVRIPDSDEIAISDEFSNRFQRLFLDLVGVRDFANLQNFDSDSSIITKEDEEMLLVLTSGKCEITPIKCFINAWRYFSADFVNAEGLDTAMEYMIKLHFTENFKYQANIKFKYIERLIKLQFNVCEEIKQYDFTKLKELYTETTRWLGIENYENI